MTKMFLDLNTGYRMETWNIGTGCLHACIYCWAKKLANTRLRERYLANEELVPYNRIRNFRQGNKNPLLDPFYPRFWEDRLTKHFKPGILVFVVAMGDLFGAWMPSEWIQRVIDHIKNFPQTDFLFLTKNPTRYHKFLFPDNAILGTTLETNRDYKVTKAPSPMDRYKALVSHNHPRKFVSIEPIMKFELDKFVGWIKDINPEFIEVGYDNYNFHLPEPRLDNTLQLCKKLENLTIVKQKTIRKAWDE